MDENDVVQVGKEPFPGTIYCKQEREAGDDKPYLVASAKAEHLVDMGEAILVARYHLVHVVEMRGVTMTDKVVIQGMNVPPKEE